MPLHKECFYNASLAFQTYCCCVPLSDACSVTTLGPLRHTGATSWCPFAPEGIGTGKAALSPPGDPPFNKCSQFGLQRVSLKRVCRESEATGVSEFPFLR